MQASPQFMFPVANEELKKPIYITEQAQLFMFSRIVVIIMIVLLFVLYRLFVPRKIKVNTV